MPPRRSPFATRLPAPRPAPQAFVWALAVAVWVGLPQLALLAPDQSGAAWAEKGSGSDGDGGSGSDDSDDDDSGSDDSGSDDAGDDDSDDDSDDNSGSDDSGGDDADDDSSSSDRDDDGSGSDDGSDKNAGPSPNNGVATSSSGQDGSVQVALGTDRIRVFYKDGSSETLVGNAVERRDPSGRLKDRRTLSAKDRSRLRNAEQDILAPARRADAVAVVVVSNGGKAVRLTDTRGWAESIKGSNYLLVDPNGNVVTRRKARRKDVARLQGYLKH